jgi:DNA-directed RNA polymerase specialized sigma24 family protein
MNIAPRHRPLTAQTLKALLERLGPERDSAALEYEAIRGKLVDLFDRRGASAAADVLADETLDRVARRVHEGEVIQHLRSYCYGVGKHVFLEWQKTRVRELGLAPRDPVREPGDESTQAAEARITGLERCLQRLPPDSRDLILAYYVGSGRTYLHERRLLAERRGISYVALKTRAHRIRIQLEDCLRRSLQGDVTDGRLLPLQVKGWIADERS